MVLVTFAYFLLFRWVLFCFCVQWFANSKAWLVNRGKCCITHWPGKRHIHIYWSELSPFIQISTNECWNPSGQLELSALRAEVLSSALQLKHEERETKTDNFTPTYRGPWLSSVEQWWTFLDENVALFASLLNVSGSLKAWFKMIGDSWIVSLLNHSWQKVMGKFNSYK